MENHHHIEAESYENATPYRMNFSETFQQCMTGDFSNRYKLLKEVYDQVEPDSDEKKILSLYRKAAQAELLPEQLEDPARVSATAPQRSGPVPDLFKL